jgi:hypothetical protein
VEPTTLSPLDCEVKGGFVGETEEDNEEDEESEEENQASSSAVPF